MKRISITIVAALCFVLSSCDDFLDLKPRDIKVVSEVEDYRDIMASFMKYLKEPTISSQGNVLGVDYETIPFYDSDVAEALAIYTGESNLATTSSYYFDKTNSVYTENGKNLLSWLYTNKTAWNRYYKFVGPINLVIEGVAEAEGDDENLRNRVLGEALVWRAYAYYKLLQFYAPYKNNTLGVPLYLTPDEEIGSAMPKRETQSAVFEQILSDCTKALALLDETNTSTWNCAWRTDFINALMADIYTWKAMSGAAEDGDWAQAEAHATAAMGGRSLCTTTADLKSLFDCSDEAYAASKESDEFFVRFVDGPYIQICNYRDAYYEGDISDGLVSTSNYAKFAENDIRRTAWFTEDGSKNDKYNIMSDYNSSGCIMPYRLADMYLIKAEALARQGNANEARTVLQEFCNARYTSEVTLPTSADELISTIQDERYREFYMEGELVWFDMKRFGVSLSRTISGEKSVLESDDFRYAFPIPATEMELNHEMVQNPGWENIIIY